MKYTYLIFKRENKNRYVSNLQILSRIRKAYAAFLKTRFSKYIYVNQNKYKYKVNSKNELCILMKFNHEFN